MKTQTNKQTLLSIKETMTLAAIGRLLANSCTMPGGGAILRKPDFLPLRL